ncbi:hypothetical protein Btru_077957 [Bulinus truncatus]|nr:hypothetical protein Btru_077957 [Bulinus truncatus]
MNVLPVISVLAASTCCLNTKKCMPNLCLQNLWSNLHSQVLLNFAQEESSQHQVRLSVPVQSYEDASIVGEDRDDRQVFPCSICGAPFSRLVIKMNHEKKCYEESKVMVRLPEGQGYKCKICGKVASLKHNLMVHAQTHRCFESGKHGEEHLKEESDHLEREKGSRLDTASTSDESFTKNLSPLMKLSLLWIRWEISKTPGGYTCLDCRRKFTDYESLIRHLESMVKMLKNKEGHSRRERVQKSNWQTRFRQKSKALKTGKT